MKNQTIPASLRNWFVAHFVIDIIFAVPLIIAPEIILPIIGWNNVDPLATRLVGAALFGIGVESLLSKNSGADVFAALLNLKILWSSAAIIGILIAIFNNAPPISWLFLGIFVLFLAAWSYYKVKLLKK